MMARDRDTLFVSRLALKLEARLAAALLLAHAVLAAALLTVAALYMAPALLPAVAYASAAAAASDTSVAPIETGVAPLDALLAPGALGGAVALGLACVAALALVGLLLALRLLTTLPKAAQLADILVPKLPAALPTIRLADLVEHTYRARQAMRPLIAVSVAAALLGFATLALHAVSLALGYGIAAVVLAALVVGAAALVFVVLPVLLLAGWLGERMRSTVARATGKPLPAVRERARQHWRWLILDGIYRIDLTSEPMQLAARPAATRWLDEASEIAQELHDCLQRTLREAGKNKLKGVGQGPFEKFAKKIGAEHVFDPSRHRFSQFAPEDVRLKIDSDATTYRLTLTSSTQANALPGEITIHSNQQIDLPPWAQTQPQVERLTLTALTNTE